MELELGCAKSALVLGKDGLPLAPGQAPLWLREAALMKEGVPGVRRLSSNPGRAGNTSPFRTYFHPASLM